MQTNLPPGTLVVKDGRFEFQFDGPKLWQSIRNALIAFGDTDFGSVTAALLEGLGSFSKTNEPETHAFILIYTALQKACVGVLTGAPEQQRLLEKVRAVGAHNTGFYGEMSKRLGIGTYSIDLEFFHTPHRHQLVLDARTDFASFLENVFELKTEQAATLASVLPGLFIDQLTIELECGDYSALETFFTKWRPTLEAYKARWRREAYHAELLRLYAKPAFEDPGVLLEQMYVEPDFWLHARCIPWQQTSDFPSVEIAGRPSSFRQTKQNLGLNDYFLSWLAGKRILDVPGEKASLFLVLGQPGQGKTSFCLHLLYMMLKKNPRPVEQVYYIPLLDVSDVKKLLKSPLKTLARFPRLEKYLGPAKPEERFSDSLLVLDGLDELSMSHTLSTQQVHKFIGLLRQEMKVQKIRNFKIVLTSRTLYVRADELPLDEFLTVHLAFLSKEQQIDWLNRYCTHYGNDSLTLIEQIERIHAEKTPRNRQLLELLNQPILLQLVTAANVDLEQGSNSAEIYKKLFDRIIQRKWSTDGRLERYKRLNQDHLRRFLQTLALHIFQSRHEYISRLDFEREGPLRQAAHDLAGLMGLEKLEIRDLLKDLLVSFYFQEIPRQEAEKGRQVGDHDHYAYEFLHKSLKEYLVAEKIWEDLQVEFAGHDYNHYRQKGWHKALEFLSKYFEPKIISQEIADYLHEIACNEADTFKKVQLKETLQYFFPDFLKNHFLTRYSAEEHGPTILDRVCNNFFGFWTLTSALISKKELPTPFDQQLVEEGWAKENIIPKDLKEEFSRLLTMTSRLVQRRFLLNHQDICDTNLSGADLREANFAGSNLCKVNFRGTNLRGANFNGAVLTEADLVGAYFSGSDLKGSDSRGIILIQAQPA